MRNVGLCGSDVYMFMQGSHGTHKIGGSGILGHEASAVVKKIGEGVTSVKVGKRMVKTRRPNSASNSQFYLPISILHTRKERIFLLM